jgi:hypothetical protein
LIKFLAGTSLTIDDVVESRPRKLIRTHNFPVFLKVVFMLEKSRLKVTVSSSRNST